jgi:hypothetical protein
MWWHTCVIPELRRQKHRDHDFNISLDYIVSFRPVKATELEFGSKKEKRNERERERRTKKEGRKVGRKRGRKGGREYFYLLRLL